jgi:hypothetical protein
LAINLFSAAVALRCRLGLQEAAGCLADEIVAVELLTIARGELGAQLRSGRLGADEAEHARDELRGLFELFEDDDVLDFFERFEPADAALAGHDPVGRQMGKVGQRLEAWFRPLQWRESERLLPTPRGRERRRISRSNSRSKSSATQGHSATLNPHNSWKYA